MRITICRGLSSALVRVEDNGRVRYFNAGRHITDRRIVKLAKSAPLRKDIEPEHVKAQHERYEKYREVRNGLRL